MIRGSGRSARGQVPETDPRFLQPNSLGRVAPATTNWGQKTALLGTNPADVQKLVRVENDARQPWTITVSSKYVTQTGFAPVTGLVAKGIFGTGGATHQVEFDARPDQAIVLPGASVDLNIEWDKVYAGVAGNVTQLILPTVPANSLPVRAEVQGAAVMGAVARGKAIRTRFVTTTVASNWIVDLPPFADGFFVSCQTDAQYANITDIAFIINNDPAAPQTVVTYTGAQLLAMKNAGIIAPVPSQATGFRITTGGASLQWVAFTLNL